MTAIELCVNGSMRAVDAPPDTPLLWVLRGELGLTGAKYGCGLDQCGSCHVLVEGESVATCQLPVGRVDGRPITTCVKVRPEFEPVNTTRPVLETTMSSELTPSPPLS